MLLGALIKRLHDEDAAAEALQHLDDLVLVTRIREAAAEEQLTLGEFAAKAVQRYSATAGNNDWVTLVSAVSSHSNPGAECLRRIIEHVLRTPQKAGRPVSVDPDQRAEP